MTNTELNRLLSNPKILNDVWEALSQQADNLRELYEEMGDAGVQAQMLRIEGVVDCLDNMKDKGEF